MSQHKLELNFFNQVIVRANNFSIENYDVNYKDIIHFFKTNDYFKLSILIASYDLYNDLEKEKYQKIKKSLMNYFKRAHFNPVPFGLFSSVGVAIYGNSNNIIKNNDYLISSEWDNFYSIKKLNSQFRKEWKNYKFYSNPSISFPSSNKIGFLKTKIDVNGSLSHEYIELDYDENLKWIINQFSEGKHIKKVSLELLKEGFLSHEIDVFIYKIINLGLIICDMFFYPYSINEKRELELTSKFLKQYSNSSIFKSNLSNFIQSYFEDVKIHKETNDNYSKIFSSTSYIPTIGILDLNIQKKIEKYILFTIKENGDYKPYTNKLKKFGNEFYHIFNDGLIPINKVFNANYGVKYSTTKSEDIKNFNKNILYRISNKFKDIFLESNEKSDYDFNSLPQTFGVVYEILRCKITNQKIVFFKSLGGASAITMLTRFNNVTNDLCEEISDFEENTFKEKIIAEINMIPQTRALNIYAKKNYYKYSIALNTVPVGAENILIDDLYLNFDGFKFNLFSKKHKKEVIPRLTSAIDYSNNTNEMYRFLCDLQYQNNELQPLNFNLNFHKDVYIDYVPRIYLDSEILLFPSQKLFLIDNYKSFENFKFSLMGELKQTKIKDKIIIPDDKGDFIVDFNIENDLKYFYKKLQEYKYFYGVEFLYSSFSSIVKNDNEESFAHEFLSTIKNNSKKETNYTKLINLIDNVAYESNTPLLSDWLYVEIYCNEEAENDILFFFKEFIAEMEFFFIRYNYPKNHLRIRCKSKEEKLKKKLMQTVEFLNQNLLIHYYQIKPYKQELSRYHGKDILSLTEKIFYVDSCDFFVNSIDYNSDKNQMIHGVNRVLSYLNNFDFTLDEQIRVCEYNILNFSKEFKIDTKDRKSLNKENALIKHEFSLFNDFLSKEQTLSRIVRLLKAKGINKFDYISNIIHMSLNRHFTKKQRFNEFKAYYFTILFLKKIKFTVNN